MIRRSPRAAAALLVAAAAHVSAPAHVAGASHAPARRSASDVRLPVDVTLYKRHQACLADVRRTAGRITAILSSFPVSYIFISHNMDFIGRTTDKVYGMAKGRILVEEERIPHTHVHTHGYGQLPHTHNHRPPQKEPSGSNEQ